MDDGDDADTVLVPRTPWPPSSAVTGSVDGAAEDTVIRDTAHSGSHGEDPVPSADAADAADAEEPARRGATVYRYRLNDRPPSSLGRAAIIGRKPSPSRVASR